MSLGGYGLWFVKCMFTLSLGVIRRLYVGWFVKCMFTLPLGVIRRLCWLVCKVYVYSSSSCHSEVICSLVCKLYVYSSSWCRWEAMLVGL